MAVFLSAPETGRTRLSFSTSFALAGGLDGEAVIHAAIDMIKLFFKTLRIILGPFMLLWEYLTRPEGILRTQEAQQTVDQECQRLTLYQFKTCPFCIKVRQEMRRLSLNIATLDAQHPGQNRDDLRQGGGEIKVPCLRIKEDTGEEQWLYESGKIIEYLRRRYGTGCDC